MDWFAAHTAGILRGSLCRAPDSTQIIWVKLMAMANEAKDPHSGRLEYTHGQPYELEYIAMNIHKTLEELNKALESFKNDISIDGTPRISIEADGTIVLNNWVGNYPLISRSRRIWHGVVPRIDFYSHVFLKSIIDASSVPSDSYYRVSKLRPVKMSNGQIILRLFPDWLYEKIRSDDGIIHWKSAKCLISSVLEQHIPEQNPKVADCFGQSNQSKSYNERGH